MTCAHLAPTQQTVRGQPQILAAFPLLIVLATCMQGLGGYKGLSMCVAREARLAEAPPEEGVGLGHAQHSATRVHRVQRECVLQLRSVEQRLHAAVLVAKDGAAQRSAAQQQPGAGQLHVAPEAWAGNALRRERASCEKGPKRKRGWQLDPTSGAVAGSSALEEEAEAAPLLKVNKEPVHRRQTMMQKARAAAAAAEAADFGAGSSGALPHGEKPRRAAQQPRSATDMVKGAHKSAAAASSQSVQQPDFAMINARLVTGSAAMARLAKEPMPVAGELLEAMRRAAAAHLERGGGTAASAVLDTTICVGAASMAAVAICS